ncbi:MAG: DUF481 domain-containing protein [Cocleimonas sp.]|nr:DUF481 domain-containing protein [Cocleimonas sp.]
MDTFNFPRCTLIFTLLSALSASVFTSVALAGNEFLSADSEGSESASELFTNPADALDEAQGWTVEAEVGFISSIGSTSNSNATLGGTAIHNKKKLKNTLVGDFFFAKSDGEKTAETLSLSHKLGYAMSNKNYVFNLLTYHQDKFENIDSRIADVFGRGRHFIKNKKHSLSNELGLGVRQTKYVDTTKSSKEMAGYFSLNYKRPLTSNTLLKEKLSILAGRDNIFTQLDISTEVKMTNTLSLSVNYSLGYNSKVQSGFKKLSKKMGITLLSEF